MAQEYDITSDPDYVPLDFVCHTDGKGLWSERAAPVRITGMVASAIQREGEPLNEYGELMLFFDKSTWNCDEHGLIYTDRTFIKELIEQLNRVMPDSEGGIEYSEQGMQTDDYVSLDIDMDFLQDYRRIFGKKVEPVVL